jgi:hypothetical protein
MNEGRIDFDRSVFINCPFDRQYKPIFDALVFVIQLAGFRPRCSLEASNAGQFRLEKIINIISECKFGIHDISRTELDRSGGLPRFNMPLELGIDLGCRSFGNSRQRSKRLLVLDKSAHRYQRFISDIAGQDIVPHSNSPRRVVTIVRDWLAEELKEATVPGGDYMHRRYALFQRDLPFLCRQRKQNLKRLPFLDFSKLVGIWLEEDEK